MNESYFTIFLIALAASFLPLQFGAEISLLANDDGVKRASGLVGGITLFRILVGVVIALLFAGEIAVLTQGLQIIGDFIGTMLSNFGQDVTSGQHVLLDTLLIVAGILLLIQAYHSLRGGPEANQTSKDDKKKVHEGGAVGLILFGLVWAAASVNQWIFVTSGVAQILALPIQRLSKQIVFVLFLILASLMIILPILIVLIRPKKANADLDKINGWINGALRYVIIVGLFVIGLFLVWKGVDGLVHFFNG